MHSRKKEENSQHNKIGTRKSIEKNETNIFNINKQKKQKQKFLIKFVFS